MKDQRKLYSGTGVSIIATNQDKRGLHTERALRFTFDSRHSSGFSCYRNPSAPAPRLRSQGTRRTHLAEPRLGLLLPLGLAFPVRVRRLEELRRDLDEPLGLDRSHVVAVLVRSEDQFMVDEPLRTAAEQRGRRVDMDGRALYNRLVASPWILLRDITEIPGANGAADAGVVCAGRDDVELVPVAVSAWGGLCARIQ